MPQKIDIPGSGLTRFILLGEDDPDDQLMLKEVFTSIDNSFILFFVDNGKEVLSAMEKLQGEHRPCLIVLDYNMPGLNGAEILKLINNNPDYADIPKIIWSTSASDKYKNLCMDLGATDYVIKPSSANELERIVRYMVSLCLA